MDTDEAPNLMRESARSVFMPHGRTSPAGALPGNAGVSGFSPGDTNGGIAVRERKKVWKRKRPIAVTVVAWAILLLFVVRLYEVLGPLLAADFFHDGLSGPLFRGMRLTTLGRTVMISGSYLVQALVGVVVLIGFLRLRRWAWVMLMVWTGASLCIALIDYFYSRPNYLVMASDVIIAFALTQSDVQRIFRIRMDPDEPAS
jgi:hypothetical protein